MQQTQVPAFQICGMPYAEAAVAQAAARTATAERHGRWQAKRCPLGCGNYHIFLVRHGRAARDRKHRARV